MVGFSCSLGLRCLGFFIEGGGGLGFFLVPVVFIGYCRKGFFSALDRPGAQQLLEHAWTESEASPPPCPGSYLYLPTNVDRV